MTGPAQDIEFESRRCVPHAPDGEAGPSGAKQSPARCCARCGRAVPSARNGRPAASRRFCSDRCRLTAVRERRAAARVELQRAAVELQRLARRIEGSLATLGLLPKRFRGGTDG